MCTAGDDLLAALDLFLRFRRNTGSLLVDLSLLDERDDMDKIAGCDSVMVVKQMIPEITQRV